MAPRAARTARAGGAQTAATVTTVATVAVVRPPRSPPKAKRAAKRAAALPRIHSYRPVEPTAARPAHTLILGTMPSLESLRQQQYYAHPRNAFWTIVAEVLGHSRATTPYAEQLARLADAGYLLWDVLHSCRRPGSLDADIVDETPNDIVGLLARHPTVRRIAFNGQPAAQLFRRHVLEPLQLARPATQLVAGNALAATVFKLAPAAADPAAGPALELVVLPSTSPAFTLPYAAKLEQWRALVFSAHATM